MSGLNLRPGIRSRVGDIMGVSNIEEYGSARLYDSWLEKSFESKSSASGLGCSWRTMSSPLDNAGLFFNETFGWPEFISMNTFNGSPSFYVPALGGRLRGEPSESIYMLLGLFDGDSFDSAGRRRHGQPAWAALGTGNGQGTIVMGEIGYRRKTVARMSARRVQARERHRRQLDDFGGSTTAHRASMPRRAMVYREYATRAGAVRPRQVRAGRSQRSERSFQFGASFIGLIPGATSTRLGSACHTPQSAATSRGAARR